MKRKLVASLAALCITGCSSTISTPTQMPVTKPSTSPSKIQHIVILVQENRSLNNIFMSFPGAETLTAGKCVPYRPTGYPPVCVGKNRTVRLTQIELEGNGRTGGTDIEHSHATFLREYDNKRMDGFDTLHYGTNGSQSPARYYPYAFVDPKEVRPYWDMASQYALADHMFSTATTDSFVAHQQVIAGTTALNDSESLTDTPSSIPWDCDNSIKSTTTGVIFKDGRVDPRGGPFPCLTQYKTMADVLDAAGVSWRYYVEGYENSPYANFSGGVWNGFAAIKAVRYGPDWKNVSIPNTRIFKDIKGGTLPQVSWLIPKIEDSDHPASGYNYGPSWVTSVVNAIGESQYWNSTAIVVIWDDWGGWYDPVPPPKLDYTSLGMRVPMIVISPYAKHHHVSKTQYEFGSILKFIEQNFAAGSLGSTDVRANSIGDLFDFGQAPKKFQPFHAPYPETFFLQSRPTIPPNLIIKNDGGAPD